MVLRQQEELLQVLPALLLEQLVLPGLQEQLQVDAVLLEVVSPPNCVLIGYHYFTIMQCRRSNYTIPCIRHSLYMYTHNKQKYEEVKVEDLRTKCLAKSANKKTLPLNTKVSGILSVLYRLDIKYKYSCHFRPIPYAPTTADNKFLSSMCLTVLGSLLAFA